MSRGSALAHLVLPALAVFSTLGAATAAQQPADPATRGETVLAIEVAGNVRLTQAQLLDSMRTRVGQPLDPQDVAHDIEQIFQRFGARAKIVKFEEERGVKLRVEIDEVPLVTAVEIRGVASDRGRDLLERVSLEGARTLLQAQVRDRAVELKKVLEAEGRYLARVDVSIEPRGDELVAVLDVTEGTEVEVVAVDFVGLSSLDPDHLRDVMVTQETRFWVLKTYLRQDLLDRDVVELERYLRREGFRDGSVAVEEIEIDDDGEEATVVLRIVEGERYTVGSVAIEGNVALPLDRLRESMETSPGGPLRSIVVEKDRRRMLQAYGDLGFVDARVDVREVFGETGTAATLVFTITEGERSRVRDVVIRGNASTRQDVVRREVTLDPGDLADAREIARTRDRLRALGYFRDRSGKDRVAIDFRGTPDPLLKDLFVDVQESSFGGLTFAAGVNSDTGFFAGVNLDKQNFDLTDTPSSWNPVTVAREMYSNEAFHGAGQSLSIRLLPGNEVSVFRLDFTEPYLFGPEVHPRSLNVTAYTSIDRLFDEYREIRYGAATTFGKEFDEHWSGGLSGRFDVVDIGDLDDAPKEVEDVEGSNIVPEVGVLLRYRDVDSLVTPTDGFEVGGRYEVLGVDAWGQRAVVQGVRYATLTEDELGRKHTLTLRGNAGVADGFGDELPFFERLNAGGISGDFPMRGFAYRGIGPKSRSVYLGGEYAMTGGAEYGFPLYSSYDPLFDEEEEFVRGVLFVDGGSLEDSVRELVTTPRLAVGAGVQVRIPFLGNAPVTLNLGFPLLEDDSDDTELFSFRVTTRFF